MKKIIFMSVCFSWVLFSSPLFAKCGGSSCTGELIDTIYVGTGASSVYIGTTGDERKLDCTPYGSKSNLLTLPANADRFDEVYALIMAAEINKEPLKVRIKTLSENCEIQYVVK